MFLWFSEGAERALELYRRVLRGAEVVSINPGPDGAPGSFMSATVRVGGLDIVVFNGEPYGEFRFNESCSIALTCEDQGEVDEYWEGLTADGGEPGQCGWLKDPFGMSWQIVPSLFGELMSSSDAAVRERVYAAMLKMRKLDCEALSRAARGE